LREEPTANPTPNSQVKWELGLWELEGGTFLADQKSRRAEFLLIVDAPGNSPVVVVGVGGSERLVRLVLDAANRCRILRVEQTGQVELVPSLLAFDAPTREECVLERITSNTPLQALDVLNDPIFVEAARGLATQAMRLRRRRPHVLQDSSTVDSSRRKSWQTRRPNSQYCPSPSPGWQPGFDVSQCDPGKNMPTSRLSSRVRVHLLGTLCLLLATGLGAGARQNQPNAITGLVPAPSAQPQGPVRFNRDVRPIMSGTCFRCHGPDESSRMGGMRLDRREEAIQARRNGTPIVPGRPEESLIVQRIFETNPARQMPPVSVHKNLTPAQKETIRRWIAEGAPYEGHWAYQQIQRPAVPAVSAPSRNPIDAFIQSRLKSEGLLPSPEADRRTLIRRVSLDLTGLAPTPQEVNAFLRMGRQVRTSGSWTVCSRHRATRKSRRCTGSTQFATPIHLASMATIPAGARRVWSETWRWLVRIELPPCPPSG
jgi:hypothetical protein